ncbi:MAG: HAMP domain-containing protein, partial [Gammaproteobacteria bacterium]|nr:HAMP domain-containing protein [Gammaproteobacteria bacterium]
MNLTLKQSGSFLLGLILLAGVFSVAGTALIYKNTSAVQESWVELHDMATNKTVLFNKLVKFVGYDGMIHQFKNYVIRQDAPRVAKVEKKINNALLNLSDYSEINNSPEEVAAIEAITNTILAYKKALEKAKNMVAEGRSSREIDKSIKINDTPMVKGLEALKAKIKEAQYSQKGTKAVYLMNLREALGFGGMIHQFKNYVLRQDTPRIAKVQAKVAEALAAISGYRSLGVNEIEDKALTDILSVVKAYDAAVLKAKKMADKGMSSQQVDKKIKISDSPATKGLDALSTEIDKSAELMTQELSKELADSIDFSAILSVISLVIFTILILLSFTIIFRKVLKPILALQNVIQQVEEKGDFSIRADVSGSKDEVNEMSVHFNKMLQSLQTVIKESNEVLANLASGRFDKTVNTQCYGDLHTLKQGINNTTKALGHTMNEIDRGMTELSKGNFHTTFKVSGEGQFHS